MVYDCLLQAVQDQEKVGGEDPFYGPTRFEAE